MLHDSGFDLSCIQRPHIIKSDPERVSCVSDIIDYQDLFALNIDGKRKANCGFRPLAGSIVPVLDLDARQKAVQEKVRDDSGRDVSTSSNCDYQIWMKARGLDLAGQLPGEPIGFIPAYELAWKAL